MSYAEESQIAQDVLNRMATGGSPILSSHAPALRPQPHDARGARVSIGDQAYTVHRHGNDLRFNEDRIRYGGSAGYAIVQILRHKGGWLVALVMTPPGGYRDPRLEERARLLVERKLVELGHEVGSPGMGGQKKSAATLDREIAEALRDQRAQSLQAKPRSRTRRAR